MAQVNRPDSQPSSRYSRVPMEERTGEVSQLIPPDNSKGTFVAPSFVPAVGARTSTVDQFTPMMNSNFLPTTCVPNLPLDHEPLTGPNLSLPTVGI